MKWQVALLCSLFVCQRAVFGSWLAETGENKGDSQCPKGQVVSGFIFKTVEEKSSSSQSSSNSSSSQSSGSSGSSGSQSSQSSQSSQVSSFKKVIARVFCANLDATTAVHANSSGKGGAGEARKSFTLKEGCKTSDADKNCAEGSFISGVKLEDGGDSPKITVFCSKDEQYELDSSIEARTIGPIKFGKGQPSQVQNPSKANDNGKCQVDAAVAVGVDDSGVSIKVASFKKKGKHYDESCKTKKTDAAKEANKTSSNTTSSSSNSSSSSSNSSSSSSNSSSSSKNSSSSSSSNSSSSSEKSMNSTASKDEKSGGGEDCVCTCNQVCKSGGGGDDDKEEKTKSDDGKAKDKKGGHSGGGSKGKKEKGGKSHHDNGNHKSDRGKRSGHKHGGGSGGKHKGGGSKKGGSDSSSSSSSSSSSHTETRSSSSSSSSSSSHSESSSSSSKTETLETKETTIEGKDVFVVKNEKKLKKCPESECNCPCVCKKQGGDKKEGGSSGGKKEGGGSGGKKGGKSHHDNGKHKGQNKS